MVLCFHARIYAASYGYISAEMTSCYGFTLHIAFPDTPDKKLKLCFSDILSKWYTLEIPASLSCKLTAAHRCSYRVTHKSSCVSSFRNSSTNQSTRESRKQRTHHSHTRLHSRRNSFQHHTQLCRPVLEVQIFHELHPWLYCELQYVIVLPSFEAYIMKESFSVKIVRLDYSSETNSPPVSFYRITKIRTIVIRRWHDNRHTSTNWFRSCYPFAVDKNNRAVLLSSHNHSVISTKQNILILLLCPCIVSPIG